MSKITWKKQIFDMKYEICTKYRTDISFKIEHDLLSSVDGEIWTYPHSPL
jgi:hypothetical protein